jgi:hypothetical protein
MKKPKKTGQEDALLMVRNREEHDELLKKFCKATGTRTESGADLIINQLMAMQVSFRRRTEEQRVIAATDLILEFEPTNPTEALLSVQMFGVHEAALLFLQRATLDGQTFEGNDANVLRATRLMRLFNEQVELMAKLKGKTSQQKVTVEHVHVHQGGQAIVGAVSAAKTDQGEGG